ncbi:MAG: amidase [Actinomycetia bacterium]|nr:amidase [Actinomycetes bacterium]MCP4084665.1 amidase [Actinomycetes bacterium]
MTDPCHLTAVEARRLIGAKQLSPVELVESCLAQTDRIDPAVNAMVIRADDRARAEAREAEAAVQRGVRLGPLHGLPVAIKDLQPTEGIRTTYGSHHHEHHVPEADAGIVARVRGAGGVVTGKTNIPEFSIGANTVNRLFGATGNPFDVDKTCGGSSGGSAVALATDMAPLATGSDHGGSLRIPACYSGVVGYRATPGVVPHEARTTPQTFYSVQGPMGRTVADTALLLSVITERSTATRRDPMAFPLDSTGFRQLDPVDLSGLRVAVTADLGGVLVSESIRRTFVDRVERIAALVGSCHWHPIDLTEALDVDWRIRQDVFVSQYHRDAAGWDEGFNPNVRATFESALETPMADIAQARRLQMDLYHRFTEVFEDYDLVICPGVGVSPFPWRDLFPREIDGHPIENYMAWLALTASITVVGHPVVALPCGLDDQQMPFGVQLIGPAYGDHRLLGQANALEQALVRDPVARRPVPDFDALASTESKVRDAEFG